MNTKELIDRIFKEPGIKFELTEFENLGKPIHEVLTIYPKVVATGKDAGKTKYYLKSLIPFSTGNEEVQVYAEGGKSAPEEIVRQLWVYKLIHQYGYRANEIDLEKGVQFGTEVGTKAADIIVYSDSTKVTPKIIVECKRPNRRDGIEQLRSYMNAKGAPVAVWSNGDDRVILYRPYPGQFDDTLFDIPRRDEAPRDVLEASKTLLQLGKNFNFKKIIQGLEELVLADSGKDEFNEIFKLIFAKIWDEKQALENRPNKVVEFRKALDPEITYDRINNLFHKACEEWPGIFKEGEDIELAKRHLQVCVGPIEGVRLMGSNLRIMDDAFEYLLPTEAKKKKGQFFTPRQVVEMCVRMLNPKRSEYVMDPACGSGGFLLHAMDWCYPANDNEQRELRKHRYAAKYLWGIDFEQRAAKTSRALMLIAGDGHTNIFGPDVSSLDPRTWYENASGQALMSGLRQARLTAKKIPEGETLKDDDKAWEYFDELRFDVILANPPFAGEMKDRKMLAHYELAKRAIRRAGDDKAAKEERDVLFIERILKMLKPGGRAAIVLPQGKFNNSSLAFIREWILKKARLLAAHDGDDDVPDDAIPEAVADLIAENFSEAESDEATANGEEESDEGSEKASPAEDRLAAAEEKLRSLKAALLSAKQKLMDLDSDAEALTQKQTQEIEALTTQWTGVKSALRLQLQEVRLAYKVSVQKLKNTQKDQQKVIKAEIKALEKQIPRAEIDLKLLSNRGKLELVLADEELIGTLKERWIAAEVAKQLDYPIFMAVSERGGKDNSGDYKYTLDEQGSLVEFPDGHPQEGQLVIDQDLVNYDLRAADLADAAGISDDQLCVAEAFVRFAQEQKFNFWGQQ
ncbi:Type I restriction-modification system methyltransferase subunit [Candidatus Accumulibacter aalborgensis]|uniref:Type I restriction-modification system methyltransferase subunit n=1 Tax=Candidatus Accumulibacter aalborgensis TaxID=1860102 RepID=A0A1A8XIC9_9PROT|nr:N-6 DNA methylase [Candidatus Accumulibacter aalborgensis]SBT03698.1 Type I restriction-modification system methyltransferase subunit [Candidatus Accumulibacter aalborgensis]